MINLGITQPRTTDVLKQISQFLMEFPEIIWRIQIWVQPLIPHHRIYIPIALSYWRGDDMTEITFKVKKPHGWDWLKDDYFKSFEKDEELRDRISELVFQFIRERIKASEKGEGEEPGEEPT